MRSGGEALRFASRSLGVALAPDGPVLPIYTDDPKLRLDLVALRVVDALAGGPTDLDDLDPRRVADLMAELGARGLLAADPPPALPPPDLTRSPVDGDAALVARTPVLLAPTPAGFAHVDNEGRTRCVLRPEELLAFAEFCRPATVAEAREAHRANAGDDALDDQAFDEVVATLVAAELLTPFDPAHPEYERRLQESVTMTDAFERRARVHAEFDRLEAEEDAAGSDDRVPVIGFHPSWSGIPSSLGLLMAVGKNHDQGSLRSSYSFRPRLVWDRGRFEHATQGRPGIYLFSNYIWSSARNLHHSALVKEGNPHSVTIHGGGDTPKYDDDLERFYAEHPHVDITVHGEGEDTFVHLLEALRGHVGEGPPDLRPLEAVPGLSFRLGDRVVRTGSRERIADLDTIPSPFLDGTYDGFLPAGGGFSASVTIETNRGCPYGCTFCDWGSATLSRIRKFDLERVFAELEWVARNGFKIALGDANFGVFKRDVEIAEKIAALKSEYGHPTSVGINYAKNTVKHLAQIIEIFTEVGILADGKVSLQTFDEDTLLTIRRKNIKLEKYHDLSVEFRRNRLPMSVDMMMGLPGATPAAFRDDLQKSVNRNVPTYIHNTVLLPNSPMNEPSYREDNGIVARPGEEIRETSSFTRSEWDEMNRLRVGFWGLENYGVLRQVATYVRAEAGMREIDFYAQIVEDAHQDPETWPAVNMVSRIIHRMMVPPVSWRNLREEVQRYLIDRVGLANDSALATVLTVQQVVQPSRGRTFPETVDLEHDYVAWHEAVLGEREQGHHADWHLRVKPLRDFPPGSLTVDDPFKLAENWAAVSLLQGGANWDLQSPLARSGFGMAADVTPRVDA